MLLNATWISMKYVHSTRRNSEFSEQIMYRKTGCHFYTTKSMFLSRILQIFPVVLLTFLHDKRHVSFPYFTNFFSIFFDISTRQKACFFPLFYKFFQYFLPLVFYFLLNNRRRCHPFLWGQRCSGLLMMQFAAKVKNMCIFWKELGRFILLAVSCN